MTLHHRYREAVLIVASIFVALRCHAAPPSSSQARGLGLLSDYYQDCPARRGPHAGHVRSVIKRALRGGHAAMRAVILHHGLFSTDGNEGYGEVPQALLRTLGDARYAAFVIRQPRDVQELALALFPEQIPAFVHRFPKTAKIYHARPSRQARGVWCQARDRRGARVGWEKCGWLRGWTPR